MKTGGKNRESADWEDKADIDDADGRDGIVIAAKSRT